MLNLKKTAVAVLAFGSSAVFAGTMGPVCTPGNVTVPCPRTAWDFGAQALYLQPNYSGIQYVGSTTNGAGAQNFNRVSNPWAWGFQIEGSYHFNTGNDLDLNWYHVDKSTNKALALGTGQSFEDRFGNFWAPGTTVSNTGSSKWDAVNLEFGQHVDFGEFVRLRLHGGVEYAHIKTKLNTAGTLLGGTQANVPSFTANSASQAINTSSSYNGFGPRVGADFGYGWNNGLNVYAKSALSMLVGSNKFTATGAQPLSTTVLNGNTVGNFSSSGSSTSINPELEAKLGASYTYAMAQGDLSLDLGWMWVNYFNVQQMGVASGVVQKSDFGLQGPYLGLKWVGNVV